MKFNNFLEELEELNLPDGKYAIFGSGPLAVRGLRDSSDLDVIVKEELWEKLSKKYSLNKNGGLQIGNIEVYNKWLEDKNINHLIDSAEKIAGYKFVKLEYVLAWKETMGRDKDKKDVELIKKYLKIN